VRGPDRGRTLNTEGTLTYSKTTEADSESKRPPTPTPTKPPELTAGDVATTEEGEIGEQLAERDPKKQEDEGEEPTLRPYTVTEEPPTMTPEEGETEVTCSADV